MFELALNLVAILLLVVLVSGLSLAALAAAGVIAAGALLERLADALIPGRRTGLGAQGIVGLPATVMRDIAVPESGDTGTVQVAGELWTAASASGDPLTRGTRVRVVEVDGMTAVVARDPSR